MSKKVRLHKHTHGYHEFPNRIDITDPCYDRGVWCRMNDVEIKPGNYLCVTWEDEVEKCVGVIGIYHEGRVPMSKYMKLIGEIGVDAGMAGFFHNKPDYNDSEWCSFCDFVSNGMAWKTDIGFWSNTACGDGEYEVRAYKDEGKIVALEIRF